MAYECALCPTPGAYDDRYSTNICTTHAEMLARGRKVTAAQDRARPSVADEAERLQARYEREAWKRLVERGVTPAVLRAGAAVAAEKALLKAIEENRTLWRCVLCRGPLTGLSERRYCKKKACKASLSHPRWTEREHPIRAIYAEAVAAGERRAG